MTNPITATLEQSQKFKELGIEFDSMWSWGVYPADAYQEEGETYFLAIAHQYGGRGQAKKIPAPQFEEIIVKLPKTIEGKYNLEFWYNDGWVVEYSDVTGVDKSTFINETITHALADMLIWYRGEQLSGAIG